MAFDFKKEYREFYLPADRPEKWKTVIRHPIRKREGP